MNYSHSFQKRRRLLSAAISLVVFAAALPALAAEPYETYEPISIGSNQWYPIARDLIIYLSNDTTVAGITIMGTQSSVITTPSPTYYALIITKDTPTGTSPSSNRRGIYVYDAIRPRVYLTGTVHIDTYGTAVEIDGGPNGHVSDINFGDYGVYASANAGAIVARRNAVINIGKSCIMISDGTDSTAHVVSAHDGGIINMGDDTSISTSNESTYGLFAAGRDSVINVGETLSMISAGGGARAEAGGTVNIGANAHIETVAGQHGLYADGSGSRITLGSKAVIIMEETDALHVVNGATAKLDGASIFTSGQGVYAMYAGGDGQAGTPYSQIDGDGEFIVSGDIFAGAGSVINLVMTDGSEFSGSASEDAGSAINLTLAGDNTTWHVKDDSEIMKLSMSGATVDLARDITIGTVLTIADLGQSDSDTGTFKMETNIAIMDADELTVTGTARGRYVLDILNRGGDVVTGKEFADLVFVKPGQSAVFTLGHIVELGGWQYDLHRPDADMPDEEPFFDPGGTHLANAWHLRGKQRSSSSGSGAINSFAGSYLMAYADTQTLAQRMGDLRESPLGQGLWFRVHGGKFESNSKTYVRGFNMDYGGVQIGYDSKLGTKWDGDLYLGAMFGYGKGDLDYSHEGSGKVDSKTLGIYGTYRAREGWYLDAILKYQWMTNDFDVIDTAGTLVRGHDVDTGGIGASMAIGRRIHVGEGKENKQGWYVEPQAQLSYQRQDGGYFNASNGLRIGVDSFRSLLGSIGMLVGYETDKANFYAKVSKVKEFDGDLTIRANGVPIEESFAGNWWAYGIGYTSRINDSNSLYVDIERTSGGSFSQPWRISAGWRIEF